MNRAPWAFTWAGCLWAVACSGTGSGGEAVVSEGEDSAGVVAPAGGSNSAGRGLTQGQTRQELLVVAETDTSTTGRLYAWVRSDTEPSGAGWSQALGPVEVVFGRGGVGPKREGDGRSPEGRFPVGDAFGYGAEAPEAVRIAYRPMPPGAVCVDDAQSSLYNTIAERGAREDRFASSEPMRRDLVFGDSLYEWGVWIGYNAEGRSDPDTGQGLGSCIFLHVWRSPGSPTAGCTAMSRHDLLRLLAWLDPSASPVVVQGRRAYLERLHEEGQLDYPVPQPQ